ncbi:hypothetical protein FB45DRAFT_322073 [Roridomyces roridus]|uniref:GATA-type domain-containing protein n=1 Tax=Roridomyces roridus TaxID=1738132 RepID=A0AAD7B6K6_9AGAR|nr:hypothetical protein FB45DRAFT_322073 [Roridomyces roridus]
MGMMNRWHWNPTVSRKPACILPRPRFPLKARTFNHSKCNRRSIEHNTASKSSLVLRWLIVPHPIRPPVRIPLPRWPNTPFTECPTTTRVHRRPPSPIAAQSPARHHTRRRRPTTRFPTSTILRPTCPKTFPKHHGQYGPGSYPYSAHPHSGYTGEPQSTGYPPYAYPVPNTVPIQVTYTDDAATKLSDRIRRRCFNCCSQDTSTWRRSTISPGKIVRATALPDLGRVDNSEQLCNKCGLYERTHQRSRPLKFTSSKKGTPRAHAPSISDTSPQTQPLPPNNRSPYMSSLTGPGVSAVAAASEERKVNELDDTSGA